MNIECHVFRVLKLLKKYVQRHKEFGDGLTKCCFHKSVYRNLPRGTRLAKLSLSQMDYMDKLRKDERVPNAKILLEDATTFSADKEMGQSDKWHSDSYDATDRLQGMYYSLPKLANEKTSVLLFPGQGTQYVGMGKHLLQFSNVREIYTVTSEILGYDLLDLSLNGPESKLSQTIYQQPAIFVASLASLEKLRMEKPDMLECCVATAGFSIGEITALTFAGAFSLESAIQVVKARAEAMQIASDLHPGAMMTVFHDVDAKLSLAIDIAKEYCHKLNLETIDVRVANYLHPNCKVIAGNKEALKFIADNKDDFKLRKCKFIDVCGAFHTNLMKPAAEVMKEVLSKVHIRKPLIPVYSNVDGRRYKDAHHITRQLTKQIYCPVKWEQIMHILYSRPKGTPFPFTYECGPGNVLRSLLNSVNSKAAERCWNY